MPSGAVWHLPSASHTTSRVSLDTLRRVVEILRLSSSPQFPPATGRQQYIISFLLYSISPPRLDCHQSDCHQSLQLARNRMQYVPSKPLPNSVGESVGEVCLSVCTSCFRTIYSSKSTRSPEGELEVSPSFLCCGYKHNHWFQPRLPLLRLSLQQSLLSAPTRYRALYNNAPRQWPYGRTWNCVGLSLSDNLRCF